MSVEFCFDCFELSCKLLKSILAGRALASLHTRRIVEYGLNKTYAGDICCDAGRVFDYTYDTVTIQYGTFGEVGSRKLLRYFRVSMNGSWIIVPVLSFPSCLVTQLGQCLYVCDPDVTEIRAKPSLRPHVT